MLLNLTFANEEQRYPGSNRPQSGVHRSGNTKRAGISRALLKILDVKAEWRCYEYPCDIDSADCTVELPETIAKPVGELHRAQQQSARTGDPMRQEPPLKRLVVLPHRILRMHQKTLIVRDHVREHEPDGGKQQVFWTQPRAAREDRLRG